MRHRTAIHKAKEIVDATEFTSSSKFLQHLYEVVKKSTKPYSYRLFSADLGLGNNNIAYHICTGAHQMSRLSAAKIMRALRIQGLERRYFARLVRMENTQDPQMRDKLFRSLVRMKIKAARDPRQRQQLSLLSDWYHGIILEALGLGLATPTEICARLRVPLSPDTVLGSLRLLTGLGLVREENQRFIRLTTDFDTGDQVPGLNVIAYHQRMIELAKEALTRIGPEEREVSALTLAVTRKKAEEIRSAIVQFQKYLLFMAKESDPGTEVLQINFQLFPLTHQLKGKNVC